MAGIAPWARKAAHKTFLTFDRVGVHVLPVHYYTPVASRRQLRVTEDVWRRPLNPIPFEWDLDAQAKWLAEQAGSYPAELPMERILGGLTHELRYGPIEAQFLYSWVRTNAPARVVEIGSGSSTEVMSLAVRRNVEEGRPATAITACDPYTADWVADLPHVTARKVGGSDIVDEVLALGAGDLLFIDSTHTVRTGSELSHIYLELLPRVQPGVVIHIHDIFLPYLFAPDIYESMFDWQETTLVAALLTGNPSLKILASQSGLFHGRVEELKRVFPEFRPLEIDNGVAAGAEGHFPSALWLQRVGEA